MGAGPVLAAIGRLIGAGFPARLSTNRERPRAGPRQHIRERNPNVSDPHRCWNCEFVNGRAMNGFLWTAVAFAIAGLLAIIASAFWGTCRTTDLNDFGLVFVGLVLLALSEAIALMLAAIGFIVKAI
jgi:hypothetical protein